MAATTYNLTGTKAIEAGGTFRKTLTWKLKPLLATDPLVPVNLTGCTARLQVREEVESAAILLSLTTENGGITLGGVLGTIVLFLSPTQTSALTWEFGVYHLEIEFPDGSVRRLLKGNIAVSPEVVR